MAITVSIVEDDQESMLLAGPAAYAFATADHASAGPIVAAGPATGDGGGIGGRFAGETAVDSRLIAYLEQHRGSLA